MGRVLVQQPGTNTTKALSETLPKNVIIVDEDLKELRLHDGVTPGGKIIGQSAGSGVPVGTIIPFAGNSVPQGYLLCDGSAISRTDYASLFAVIGTIYGAGDGNSTFNLPNLDGCAPWYDSTVAIGSTSNGGIPNATGRFGNLGTYTSTVAEGVFTTARNGPSAIPNSGTTPWTATMDLSRASSVYKNNLDKVIPAHINMGWCVKY